MLGFPSQASEWASRVVGIPIDNGRNTIAAEVTCRFITSTGAEFNPKPSRLRKEKSSKLDTLLAVTMMSTKALGLGPSLRRAALSPRLVRNQVALRSSVLRRTVQTESLPPSAAVDILNKQRLNRPSSPHFTIYQPQLTWLGSIAHRVTGAGLSVLLYGFSIGYLVAPGTLDSTHLVELVQGLPDVVKYAGKTILAAPFAFHTFNGLRHLAWDTGKFVTVKGAYATGYAVLGATAVATVGLVLW
ncbi:hypothetical protein AX16_007547 [Volvariella volvacea WC 439]|nr:hypothetical protein AX16_007547 [Volvariella volvacea WC 439]